MPASGKLQIEWPDHPGSPTEASIRAGRFDQALAQIEPVIAAHPGISKLLRIKHDALMGARRFDEAALAIEQAVQLKPGNVFYRKLHAIALKDAGRFSEALPLLADAIANRPDDTELLAAMCVAHFRLGNVGEALACGQRKLDLLVAQESLGDLEDVQKPALGGRDVVAFSLWGSAAQYCRGALLNARQIPGILPDWTARFYIDRSVPEVVVTGLRESGAEVVDASDLPVPPLMRRFLVHDDPVVGRYLIRDSDSRIGPREIATIEAWQSSGKAFHAIRDHLFHHELIQGGLWGGTAGQHFSMAELLGQFEQRFGVDHRYGADQFFLGRYVWPIIGRSLLTHDSYYRTPGSRPFPDGSRGRDTDHVGMGIVLRG